jgi:hypothetical protein
MSKRVLKKDLEKRIVEQKQQIRELVLNPNSFESTMIQASIKLEYSLEKAIWFGYSKSFELKAA